MRPILRINSDVIELNALFIQPTRWCGLDCPGCYVKEHGDDLGHTPWQEQHKVFQAFYKNQQGCWSNQITISIDDLPKKRNSVDLDGLANEHRRKHMLMLFRSIISDVHFDIRDKDDRPEVHMTFHTHHTIEQYEPSYTKLRKLDMISISEISTGKGDFYQNLRGGNAILNWNYLIPEIKGDAFFEKEVRKFEFANKHFDHIYLVINKTPVGRGRDLLTRIGDQNRMKNDILYINTILGKVSPELRNKISVDGCLLDTQKFRATNFGCSSNISKFQVWPDGSVSGCPYAYGTSGKVTPRAEGILDNIRAERKRYDFKERCHLPQVYSAIG